MKPAEQAWLAIAAIVITHNVSASDGDTLSEAVDDWIVSHPVLTRTVIAVLALHLTNAISNRLDPVHLAFVRVRAVSRRRVIVVVEPA